MGAVMVEMLAGVLAVPLVDLLDVWASRRADWTADKLADLMVSMLVL